MLDAYGFEVPLEREREYKEWSRRYYKPARNSAEEAQVRAWLLHLVKFKGDECAAYLRSPELTALVRRGIPSQRIPPANASSIASHRTTLRGKIWLALSGTNAKIESENIQRRDGLGRVYARLRLRAQEGAVCVPCSCNGCGLSGCRYAHETSASQFKADVTREAEQPSASADEGFAGRPPTFARSLRTAALWPQAPARSTNGHFVSYYASLKRASWSRATTAAVGCPVSIGARCTVRAE